MPRCCLWWIKWKGLVENEQIVAGGGELTLRALNQPSAIYELARGLSKFFNGNCRFFGQEIFILKIQDNPPVPVNEGIVENIIPKLEKIYGQVPIPQKQVACG